MKIKASLIAIGFSFLAINSLSLSAESPRESKPEVPDVQVMTAKFKWKPHQKEPDFTITGVANLSIKKVRVDAGEENPGKFTVHLTVDDFAPDVGRTLMVRVKDKFFRPYSYGGDHKKYWSLELRDIDRTTVEIVNGESLKAPPENAFRVDYLPHQKSYPTGGPVRVGISLRNVGEIPLTIGWGTHGGGNYTCRDTQLSFTATLNGKPVPANPKPLPDGFISSPFVSKPASDLQRSEDLAQWIQFEEPGHYHIEAAWTVQIENPEKDVMPTHWAVVYRNAFVIQIGTPVQN